MGWITIYFIYMDLGYDGIVFTNNKFYYSMKSAKIALNNMTRKDKVYPKDYYKIQELRG